MALNTITPLTEYVFTVSSVEQTTIDNVKLAEVVTLEYKNPASLSLAEQSYEFVQTEDLTEQGIAVQPYGAFIINTVAPTNPLVADITLEINTPGGVLVCKTTLSNLSTVETELTFAAAESAGGGGESSGT